MQLGVWCTDIVHGHCSNVRQRYVPYTQYTHVWSSTSCSKPVASIDLSAWMATQKCVDKRRLSSIVKLISYLTITLSSPHHTSTVHYASHPEHKASERKWRCLDGHCAKHGVARASSCSGGGGVFPKLNWQLKSS